MTQCIIHGTVSSLFSTGPRHVVRWSLLNQEDYGNIAIHGHRHALYYISSCVNSIICTCFYSSIVHYPLGFVNDDDDDDDDTATRTVTKSLPSLCTSGQNMDWIVHPCMYV